MMRLFLDTNIVIDYLAHREKFFSEAATIISLSNNQNFQILVSSLTFATAYYILSSHNKISSEDIKSLYSNFIKKSHVTPVDSLTVEESIASCFDDIEDAMQYYSALRENADVIITRNKSDFEPSHIPVYEPKEFIKLLTDRK